MTLPTGREAVQQENNEKKIAEGLALLREGTKGIPVAECPECGGSNVQQDECEEGIGEVLKEMCSCNNCGAVWRNYYEIFGQTIADHGDKP